MRTACLILTPCLLLGFPLGALAQGPAGGPTLPLEPLLQGEQEGSIPEVLRRPGPLEAGESEAARPDALL